MAARPPSRRLSARRATKKRRARSLIRVLIADDHLAVREGVRAMLALERDIEIVAEAADGPSTLRLAREHKPDLIVLDNSMPGLSGLDVARTLKDELPDTGIVFLTMDPALRDLALAGGAMAYVLKDAPSEELLRAVRATTAALAVRRRLQGLPASHVRLIDLLLGSRALTTDQLDAALAARQANESLASVLLRIDVLAEPELADALARASGTPLVSLAPYPEVGAPIKPTETRLAAPRVLDPIDRVAARILPRDVARGLGVVMIAASRGEGVVAMADPLDEESFAETRRRTGLRLERVTATLTDVLDALDRSWEPGAQPPALFPSDLRVGWRSLAASVAAFALPILGFALFFREGLTPNRFFPFFALFCGFFFFVYALKYYVTSATVLAVALFGDTLVLARRNGNGNGKNGNSKHGNGKHGNAHNGNARNGSAKGNARNGRSLSFRTGFRGHREGYKTLRGEKLDVAGAVVVGEPWPRIGELRLPAERQPFVSIHLALYNEKRVVDRLLAACTSFDYENYEVIVVDDSTDETVQALARWKNHPHVRVVHRPSRAGFKGGALQEALRRMNPRAEYVMVFDADFIPPADAIWHFLDYFGRLPVGPNGNGNGHNGNGHSGNRWNGRERRGNGGTSYAGSERRQKSNGRNGRATNGNGHRNGNGAPVNGERLAAVQGYQWHMLNASENWITKGVRAEFAGSYVLERAGQELFRTLKMISGSVYMIRADVLRALGWSTSITEDWELTIRLYLAGYKVLYTPYIQAPAECVSTIRRLIKQRMRWAEGHTYNVRKYFFAVLRSPNLTLREKLEFAYYAPYYLQAVVFTVGTIAWLASDLLLGQRLPNWTALLGWSLVFTNILALPLMNLAGVTLEGSVRRDLPGIFSFIALSNLLVPFQAYAALRGLFEHEEGAWARTPKSGRITEALGAFRLSRLLPWELPQRRRRAAARPVGKGVAVTSFVLLAAGIVGLGAFSIRAAAASGEVALVDLALIPGLLGTIVPLALVIFAYWKARRFWVTVALFTAIFTSLITLGTNVQVAIANPDTYYLHNTAVATGLGMDGTAGSSTTTSITLNSSSQTWYSTTYPTGNDPGSIAAGTYTANLRITAVQAGNQLEITVYICPAAGCTGAETPVVQRACAAVSAGAGLQAFTIGTTGSATSLPAPANSNRIAFTLRACKAKDVTIAYDGAVGSNRESNLSTPAVTVPDATLFLAPLALAVPLMLRRLRRREAAA